MTSTISHRQQLDQLFAFDSIASVVFGVLALLSPHHMVDQLGGGYNHSTHEALRLYGCLRLACGWILWHSLAVMRAQFTDKHVLVNWIAILILLGLSAAYGSFRFGSGGHMIKVYELPTSGTLQ